MYFSFNDKYTSCESKEYGDQEMFDNKDLVLVIIDLQDKLVKIIPRINFIIMNTRLLTLFAMKEQIPIIATKQVKLGNIISELKKDIADYAYIVEKKSFSCFGSEEFTSILGKLERKTLIITGIETHICVLQTVFDAVKKGYNVIVAVDAIGSQIPIDHEYGVRAIEKVGAQLLPAESIVYGLMRSSDHPSFKEILEKVKKRRRMGLGSSMII